VGGPNTGGRSKVKRLKKRFLDLCNQANELNEEFDKLIMVISTMQKTVVSS
jgi:hypothetical protein